MKPGDLVKTTLARIGCPLGTFGLILRELVREGALSTEKLYDVKLIGSDIEYSHCNRSILERDLTVVSAG